MTTPQPRWPPPPAELDGDVGRLGASSYPHAPAHHHRGNGTTLDELATAVIWHRQGFHEAALRLLRGVEARCPHDATAYFWLGRVLVALQRYELAQESISMCLELLMLQQPSALSGSASSPQSSSAYCGAAGSPSTVGAAVGVPSPLGASSLSKSRLTMQQRAASPVGIQRPSHDPNGDEYGGYVDPQSPDVLWPGAQPPPLSPLFPRTPPMSNVAELVDSIDRIMEEAGVTRSGAMRSTPGSPSVPPPREIGWAQLVAASPTISSGDYYAMVSFTRGEAVDLLRGVRRVLSHRRQQVELTLPPTRQSTSTFGWRLPVGDGRSLLRPRTIPRTVRERAVAILATLSCFLLTLSAMLCDLSTSITSRVLYGWAGGTMPPASLRDDALRRRVGYALLLAVVMGFGIGWSASRWTTGSPPSHVEASAAAAAGWSNPMQYIFPPFY